MTRWIQCILSVFYGLMFVPIIILLYALNTLKLMMITIMKKKEIVIVKKIILLFGTEP